MKIRKQKKGTPAQYRQGDVFLIAVDQVKGVKQERPADRLVLEYGEVTGHAHAIYETEKVDLYLEGTRRYLEVCFAIEAPLKHEEHDTINLPKGTYEVRRQRTWSVLEQMQKVVVD